MAYVIFFAGLFLGTIIGFVVMALLAVGSRASKPERYQLVGVISPGAAASDAILPLRWRAGHRRSELGLPLGTRGSG